MAFRHINRNCFSYSDPRTGLPEFTRNAATPQSAVPAMDSPVHRYWTPTQKGHPENCAVFLFRPQPAAHRLMWREFC